MREAGGIPLVKTNVSQGLANFECSNPLWGTTKNPYNEVCIPGGSSGGEGALLAMGGSAIGWGSDLGGSIRIPSHFCGLYGLKPGSGRVSLLGTVGEQFNHVSAQARRPIHSGYRSESRVQKYPDCTWAHGKNRQRHRDRFPSGIREIRKLFLSTCAIS